MAAARQVVATENVVLDAAAQRAVAEGRLNRAQAAAAYAPPGPVLVLGPPGTGKTKTLVERIGVLLDRGVEPGRIFCGTFTVAAAGEIVARVNERHGGRLKARRGERLTFGTLNSLGRRLLDVLGPRAGLDRMRLVKAGEAAALARRLGIKLDGEASRHTSEAPPAPEAGGVRPEDLGWHGAGFGGNDGLELEGPGEAGAGGPGEKGVLGQLVAGRLPAATALGRVHDLPFLDLVATWEEGLIFPEDAVRIATGDGGRYVADEALARRAAEYQRYKAALREEGLIDFADQIALPVKILRERVELLDAVRGRFDAVLNDEYQDDNRALGALVDLVAGGHRNLWCVGDPDQTMYGFRGSDPSFILGFGERWPGASVIALAENYRCRPPIVEAANRVIRHNKDRYETAMRAAREAAVVPVEIGRALSTPDRRRDPSLVRQVPIEVVEYPDDTTEGRDVARKVRELLAAGVSASEIAVLCRSGYRGYFVTLALRGAGVRFRDAREPERRGVDPAEVFEGLVHAVHFPVVDGSVDAERIRRLLGGGDAAGHLITVAASLKGEEGFDQPDRWDAFMDAADGQLAALVQGLAGQEAGAVARWEARWRAAVAAARERGGYRAWCEAAPAIGRGGDDTAITLSTMASIHGAKGLEWQHVFLVGAENDVCPYGGAVANEEERRLFYVGVTRARESLTVSWTARRAGDRFAAKPSVYLEEACQGTPGVAWSVFGRLESGAGTGGSGTVDLDTLENAGTRVERRRRASGRAEKPAGSVFGAGVFGAAVERAGAAAVGAPAAKAEPPGPGQVEAGAVVAGTGVAPARASLAAATVDQPPKSDTTPPLRFRLEVGGGVENAVWRLRLVSESGRVVIESLVNPDGDYMAAAEAMGEGVPPDALVTAPPADEVLGQIREALRLAEMAADRPAVMAVESGELVAVLRLDGWPGLEVGRGR